MAIIKKIGLIDYPLWLAVVNQVKIAKFSSRSSTTLTHHRKFDSYQPI